LVGTAARGRARARIRFRGKTGDSRSLKGGGKAKIEEGKLTELPLFLGLLSLLFGDDSGRHYFRDLDLGFKIEDGKFVAESGGDIEIRSTGVKLSGKGTMDFEGNLDLTFEPFLLDVRIPVVDEILGLLKKGLSQIWITGNLSSPKMQFVTGAGIVRIGVGGDKERTDSVPLPSDLRETEGQGAKSLPDAASPPESGKIQQKKEGELPASGDVPPQPDPSAPAEQSGPSPVPPPPPTPEPEAGSAPGNGAPPPAPEPPEGSPGVPPTPPAGTPPAGAPTP
jgi:hypothetical protein